MNGVFLALERAGAFGLAALVVAVGAQWMLNGRVPAAWRVWIWRVALLQTALALIPLAPLRVAVLPPRSKIVAPFQEKKIAPRSLSQERHQAAPLPAIESSPAPDARSAALPLAAPAQTEAAAPSPALAPRVTAIRPRNSVTARQLILAGYALGLAVQFVILARAFGRVRRLVRACTALQNAEIEAQLQEIACRMRVSRLPRLL